MKDNDSPQAPINPPDDYWAELNDDLCPICEKRLKTHLYNDVERCEHCTIDEMEKHFDLEWFETANIDNYKIN